MARKTQQQRVVEHDLLMLQADGRKQTVVVGSEEWYAWLEDSDSFSYSGEHGSFTAHKARAGSGRGGWYWRAYSRRQGRLLRVYLGRSADLSPERLSAAATQLNSAEIAGAPGESSTLAHAERATASDALVITKLYVPRLSVQHVSRPHLLALMNRAVATSALTIVSAPAGSGKTSLLAEWAQSRDRDASTTDAAKSVAWLALESADDEPVRFVTYLTAALAGLDPRIGIQAFTLLRAAHGGEVERVLSSLINDLAIYLIADAALILDDYHLIASAAVNNTLLFLLDHLPQRLRVVLGTRVDPPLPLARWRARGQLAELHGEDLRFSPVEAAAFLHEMGFDLSADDLHNLEQRAEGWIAGIQLLALALRGRSDPSALLSTLSGSHRFIAEYLSEEVLRSQPAERRDFLLRTSVLERMCGPLCDALTGDDSKDGGKGKGKGGSGVLAELRRDNLFISALDDAEEWYRYHPLFAAALREQLQKEQPALVPELYRRAAEWYAGQDLIFEAIDYALLAGDFDHAAGLMEPLARNLVRRGDMNALQHWVGRLPDATLYDHPHLSLAAVWVLLFDGQETRMRELMAQVERYVNERQGAAGMTQELLELHGELRIFEAVTAMPANDNASVIERARLALETLPDDAHYLRNLASLSIAIAMSGIYRASGDIAAAERVLAHITVDQVEGYHFLSMIAMHDLADLYGAEGRLRAMDEHYARLLSLLPATNELPAMLVFFVCVDYAMLMYEWNRLDDADALLDRVTQARQQVGGMEGMFSLIPLLRSGIDIAQGRLEQVTQTLSQLDEMRAQGLIPAPMLSNIGAERASILLAVGKINEALGWAREYGLRPAEPLNDHDAAEVFPQDIVAARIFIESPRASQDKGNLEEVLRLLEKWRSFTEQRGFNGWLIKALAIEALALNLRGQTRKARAALVQALALAEPEGFIRTFVDLGEPMFRLLASLVGRPQKPGAASPLYIKSLLAAMPGSHRAQVAQAGQVATQHTLSGDQLFDTARSLLVEPLTPREDEVLKLLATGLSNQDIADKLIITPNTAKRHVKHILAKLDASNRVQAVARARELHLL